MYVSIQMFFSQFPSCPWKYTEVIWAHLLTYLFEADIACLVASKVIIHLI